ncbi:hypothetical protein H1P_1270014 [Hyella patelloides LEGE 07179]|uniref:Uncharacterized protein n=1 Tax=Hyella patelloides LEGE 07179 TaxID=945734 RepID=A0A563VKH5_9CYAN|nr:hypothetical protein H1P_1270014 [Hyella patelloides LEGE 07179]
MISLARVGIAYSISQLFTQIC